MPKVSVIIPVYNTEKYLKKCLDSVCNQTLSDIEIICINDCSTDNSLEILNEYASKDDRIKIINFEENKGAAVARNVGIDTACGEYIGFVDSDDFVDSDFYEKLYNTASENNSDIAKGEYKYTNDGLVNEKLNEKIKECKTNFSFEYCSAIFKTKLIKDNGIKFPILRDMEDPVFAFHCANCTNNLVFVEDCYINICKRPDSTTARIPDKEQVSNKIKGIQKLIETAKKYNTPDLSVSYVLALWFYVTLNSTYESKFEDKCFASKKILEFYQTSKYKDAILYHLRDFSNFLAKAIKSGDLNKILSYKQDETIYKNIIKISETRRTINALEKNNKKLALEVKNLNLNNFNETVFFISVVNNYDLYNRCIKNNPFVTGSENIKLVEYNNIKDNVYIAKRYNSFLNNYNYSKEAWFVFCHCDWEPLEDINLQLSKLDKSSLYGPVGSKVEIFNNKCYRTMTGCCYEKRRDGSDLRYLTSFADSIEPTDTFDCQCLIVHSSLIKKYNLRFDENLKWDLYVEDFCINSKLNYNINSYALYFACCHWSGYHDLPKSYLKSIEYVNSKYPNNIFGGTVSEIGGKKYPMATEKDLWIHAIRKKHLSNKGT